MIKVKYSGNNSGGSFWTEKKDHETLKKEGWKTSNGYLSDGEPTEAEGEFPSIKEALQSFERATGLDVTEEGCNCCGAPHRFEWTMEDGTREYASGEELIKYLFNKPLKKLRDFYE